MKRLVTFLCLGISLISYGQRTYTANAYFEDFAYAKAAELYEAIYKKGDSSQFIISRLGDAHYLQLHYETAEKWYRKLFDLYKDQVAPAYYFKYAQTLKNSKHYQESDRMMAAYYALKKPSVSAQKFANRSNYVETYSQPNTTITSVQNLSINTAYSDFGAFVYQGELYFASARESNDQSKKRYAWNRQPFLNLYSAQEQDTLSATKQKVYNATDASMLSTLNTQYHEATAVITKDGSTLYFTRDNFNGSKLKTDNKRTSHLKIYKAVRKNNEWTDITELPINDDTYSTGHPALSPDEKTLYFVSDRPGGYGETDLYKVNITGSNSFGTPINLGEQINTDKKEMFPFVGADNTLYFASNGHLGLGGLDIYASKISGNNFDTPEHLGAPINSSMDDFAYFIDAENTHGYFSSNRAGGKGDDDIYSFAIYHCAEQIVGVAYDATTKQPLPKTTVHLLDASGKTLATVLTDSLGAYRFNSLACSESYTVVASKNYYTGASQTVATKDIHLETIPSEVSLTPLIADNQIVINPIFFDFDKSNIREDAEYELEKVVSVMKSYPSLVIKIESHTDSRGNSNYNRKLSDRRAKSTRDYIISRGIDAQRIESAIGYGEDRLLNNCNDANRSKCTEEEHQRNRRSYFFIVSGLQND